MRIYNLFIFRSRIRHVLPVSCECKNRRAPGFPVSYIHFLLFSFLSPKAKTAAASCGFCRFCIYGEFMVSYSKGSGIETQGTVLCVTPTGTRIAGGTLCRQINKFPPGDVDTQNRPLCRAMPQGAQVTERQSPLLLKEGASRSEAGDLTLIAVRRTIKFASVRELYRSFVSAQITEGRLNSPAAGDYG